jgi:hypothetical protein
MTSRVVVAIVSLILANACGASDANTPSPPPPVEAGAIVSPAPGTGGTSCAAPTAGCPCDPAGKQAECKIFRRAGDYVACSVGVATCGDDLVWGACEGAAQVWEGE